MARKKRQATAAFNLSFLDIMSCGFGAIVLLFLIMKHSEISAPNAEEARLQRDIADRYIRLETLEQQIEGLNTAIAAEEDASATMRAQIAALVAALSKAKAANEDTSKLIAQQRAALEASQKRAEEQKKADIVETRGDGEKRYLTGMQVDGSRIVLLLDRSASMVDKKLVDIIRRRAMGGRALTNAPKWNQAQDALRWLVNNLPERSNVQILSFSDTVTNHGNGWIKVTESEKLARVTNDALSVTPSAGTNLQQALSAVGRLSPGADSVYLITDGLPTLSPGAKTDGAVSGKKRTKYFSDAIKALPSRSPPINVILLPLEGDPYAPYAYWQLAYATGGRMLSPAGDWP